MALERLLVFFLRISHEIEIQNVIVESHCP